MSDDPKHNKIQPINRMADELTTLSGRWAQQQATAGDNDDKRAIMEIAYRLRWDMDGDPGVDTPRHPEAIALRRQRHGRVALHSQ